MNETHSYLLENERKQCKNLMSNNVNCFGYYLSFTFEKDFDQQIRNIV